MTSRIHYVGVNHIAPSTFHASEKRSQASHVRIVPETPSTIGEQPANDRASVARAAKKVMYHGYSLEGATNDQTSAIE